MKHEGLVRNKKGCFGEVKSDRALYFFSHGESSAVWSGCEGEGPNTEESPGSIGKKDR